MDVINKIFDDSFKKQAVLDNSLKERANRIHGELVREVKELNYDFYHRNFIANDELIDQSRAAKSVDLAYRKKLGGPSIRQEKHHSSYWKYWYNEKNLLDQLSIKEYNDEVRRLTEKKVLTDIEKSKRELKDRNKYLESRRMTSNNHNIRVEEEQFLVQNIWTNSLKLPIPSEKPIDSACNIVYGPVVASPPKEGSVKLSSLPAVKQTKGGAFGRDKKLPSDLSNYTKGCDVPPLPSAFDPSSSTKGKSFSSAKRFAPSPHPPPSLPEENITTKSLPNLPPGGKFDQAERFPGDNSRQQDQNKDTMNAAEYLKATPGPGTYEVKRLFDYSELEKHRLGMRDFEEIFLKYNNKSQGLNDWTAQERCQLGKMGMGCNLEEHVLLGMCRDQNCLTRSMFERTMLNTNDKVRMGGYPYSLCTARPKSFDTQRSKLSRPTTPHSFRSSTDASANEKLKKYNADDIELLKVAADLLPRPIFVMSPLYAAVVFGDVNVVKELGAMKVNPNQLQPDTGYTPLHIGAVKNQMKAVYHMLHYFHNPNVVNPGSKTWLNINTVDKRGNTALHYASKFNRKEICAMLCQEEDIDPFVVNHQGEKAIDIVGGHEVFTLIKFCQEKLILQKDLAILKHQQLKQTSRAANIRIRANTNKAFNT